VARASTLASVLLATPWAAAQQFPATTGPAAAPLLPAPIAQALLDSGLPVSAVSLWVQPVEGGPPRLALQADTPRQMASVMKLMTTGVALRMLGPAYRWHTAAALQGRLDAHGVLRGNVHLKASGDPSLDAMRLGQALRAWREAGLREIRGDVVVDRGLWGVLPPFDAAAFDGQPLKPYNAGPEPWLLAHGAVSLTLRPDPARAQRVRVGLSPALAGVTLDTDVALDPKAPCGDWRQGLRVEITPDAGARRTVRVSGHYPAACQDQAWPLRWPAITPFEHSARVFEAAWEETGGRLRGQVREGPWPMDATPWVDWVSPPLAEVVRDINKFSNNVMARQLFLTLSQEGETAPAASLDAARARVSEAVRQATREGASSSPCDGEALQLDNGSGLSRTEIASTHCMARWVQVMWRDPLMPEWLASLPVAGVDGTARRMSAGVGLAHLKTGSLDGVASIAGVVQDTQGRRSVVVAVVNDPRAQAARGLLQAVVGWASAP
jgi:D-alanyl-D-alanine carboxypeptidase/D-alanyl-D-alanine-endopeptidase (penicillin-binding protein 4)